MAIILDICLTPSDWIAISNIIVTSIIGIWIGIAVQRNLTTNRAVKEFFISESKDIKEKYNRFIKDLYTNKLSAESIKEWLKIMTIKLNTFEGFIQNEYRIKPSILEFHNKIKYYITGSDDFNSQYKEERIKFSSSAKTDILDFHSILSDSLTNLVIGINKAKRNYFCKKKYGQHTTRGVTNLG